MPFLHLIKDVLKKARWVDQVSLDRPVIDEKRWWHGEMKNWSGKSIITSRSQMVVTTDASSFGWDGGGSSDTREVSATRLGGFWLPKEHKTMQFRVPCEKLLNIRREIQSVVASNDQQSAR